MKSILFFMSCFLICCGVFAQSNNKVTSTVTYGSDEMYFLRCNRLYSNSCGAQSNASAGAKRSPRALPSKITHSDGSETTIEWEYLKKITIPGHSYPNKYEPTIKSITHTGVSQSVCNP